MAVDYAEGVAMKQPPAQSQACEPVGEVVVTTNKSGQCVAVTRQNEDGEVLSVIWEAAQSGEAPQRALVEAVCEWDQDSDGTWQTSCGHEFQFIDDGPEENQAFFCLYCGGKLKPNRFTDDDEEDTAALDGTSDGAKPAGGEETK